MMRTSRSERLSIRDAPMPPAGLDGVVLLKDSVCSPLPRHRLLSPKHRRSWCFCERIYLISNNLPRGVSVAKSTPQHD
jgi:hypothetical protein